MRVSGLLLATAAITLLGGCAAIPSAQLANPVPAVLAPQAPAATAHPDLWPAARSPDALSDQATEQLIDRLLARMPLEQKVGQIIQGDISSVTPADLTRYPLGSILAGGNSGPYGDERGSSSKWARLVGEFRAASARAVVVDGVAIPTMFGVDAVHGHNNLPGATVFPHNIGLGAARDPGLIRRIGEVTAEEISASGIEWTFAPTLAVPQDLRWGRSYEGYSADPALVAQYSRQMVLGLQGPLVKGQPILAGRVASTAKHFLADGGTFGGKDQGDARIDERSLVAIHAQGYPAAIDAGALTMMVSFSSWNGAKNHGNRSLMTDIAKQRMGFAGLLVGDWNGHGQVEGCTNTHCPQAINAGLDMFMAPDSWKDLYASTLDDVRAGRIPLARLDDAVRRILRVKAKLGLLGNVRAVRDTPGEIGSPAHRSIAREAVAKSLVLLKNEGSLLPIRPGAKVLVAGNGADNMAKQAGGWTITWQGTDTAARDFPASKTIWQGIAGAITESGGRAVLSANGSFTERPDAAIVVIGEDPYAEFQGDIETLDYQPLGATDLTLIRNLKAQGIPVITVFLSGRPLFAGPEINASDAFVAAWLPGSEGDGVADVLVAGPKSLDFTGRLPFAWPANARSPVADPAFPAGYGLSYAAPAHVGVLNEDPQVEATAQRNVARYFAKGAVLAPWALSLGDKSGAFELGTREGRSPLGLVTSRPVDVAAQEDARLIEWSGDGFFEITGPESDLRQQLTGSFMLMLELDVTRPATSDVLLSADGATVPLTALLRQAGAVTVRVPLRCFADQGASFERVRIPLRIASTGQLGIVLKSARLEPIGEPLACPR